MTRRKAAIFLWFDTAAEEAATFYAETFPESRIERVIRPSTDVPGTTAGAVQLVEMTLCGLPYTLLNAGPHTVPNDAYSLQIYTGDQAETDRLWDAITGNGGEASQCGWCRDRWGFRWQITPYVLMDALSDRDPGVTRRAMEAMLTMQKIDIAAIEVAVAGGGTDHA